MVWQQVNNKQTAQDWSSDILWGCPWTATHIWDALRVVATWNLGNLLSVWSRWPHDEINWWPRCFLNAIFSRCTWKLKIYIYILILPSWLHWGFGGVLVAWANYRMVSQSPYSQSHMVAPSLMSETYKNGWTTELRITTKLTYTFWMFVHSLPQFKTCILSCSGDWSQLCHTLSSLRGWGWK